MAYAKEKNQKAVSETGAGGGEAERKSGDKRCRGTGSGQMGMNCHIVMTKQGADDVNVNSNIH